MGLTAISEIARELIARGRSPETPAVAVRWATRPDQQTVAGTIASLPARIAEANLKPPATIIVGEVVRLREKLNWFERLPLFGRRIIVTRAAGQSGALAAKLRALGTNAIEVPAIEIRPYEDYSALDAAIARLETYDWLIFTSANGVRYFLERLDRSERDLRAIRARVAAIGPATRSALEALHLKVDLMGAEFVAESLLEAFAAHDIAGRRILLPRAAVARDMLPEGLRARGALVDVAPAYRTVAPGTLGSDLAAARGADWIAFTSSSTVDNVIAAAGTDVVRGVRIASIGPVTSATLRRHGLEPAAEANPYTEDGLIQSILRRQV
jgi:uroporphyrinogen III methyltransferase/synthase